MRLNPPSQGFASAAVFISASAWGLYWIPLKYFESHGLTGAWAIAFINGPAAIILLGLFALNWPRYKSQLKQVLLIGLLTGAAMALYGSGLVYSSVIRATLLFYLTPIWATLIGILWLGEAANRQRWTAIAGGLTGLVLLLSGSGSSIPLGIGDLYAFLSGIIWAIGAALIMRGRDLPVTGMAGFQFLFAALGAIFFGALAGIVALPTPAQVATNLPLATVISILVMLPAVAIIFWAQKYLFPGRVGLLMMSEVVVSVLTASYFLADERMGPVEWLGGTLIVAACLVEVLASPKKQAPG